MNELYGIDPAKLKEWIKRNGVIVLVCFGLGFAIGWVKTEASIEMDCKYAKAVRIGTSAFECKRIL